MPIWQTFNKALSTSRSLAVDSYYWRAFWMKTDGWIKARSSAWVLRFRYDWESWEEDPRVLVDKGRLEPSGVPLLKARKHMRRKSAVILWRNLLVAGWERVKPQWD